MANYNAGTLSPSSIPYSAFNYVASYDTTDVFQFQLNSTADINIALDPIYGDADIALYRDNGNGYLDAYDTFVGSSIRYGTADDSLNIADQTAGTYFAQVNYYSSNYGYVYYNLDISTTYDYTASNLLPQDYIVGDLSGDVTYTGYVGASDPYEGYRSDTTDTYYFTLGFYEGVNITLSGLSSDADIRLIQDSNNNGIVDSGEVLGTSANAGTTPDSINGTDLSGNYFLQVYQWSGNTNYNLTFDHYTTSYA